MTRNSRSPWEIASSARGWLNGPPILLTGRWKAEVVSAVDIARIYYERERPDHAIEYYERALGRCSRRPSNPQQPSLDLRRRGPAP